MKLKNEIKAKKFIQVSSLDNVAVKEVMDTAIDLALEYQASRSKAGGKAAKKGPVKSEPVDAEGITSAAIHSLIIQQVLNSSIDMEQIEVNRTNGSDAVDTTLELNQSILHILG